MLGSLVYNWRDCVWHIVPDCNDSINSVVMGSTLNGSAKVTILTNIISAWNIEKPGGAGDEANVCACFVILFDIPLFIPHVYKRTDYQWYNFWGKCYACLTDHNSNKIGKPPQMSPPMSIYTYLKEHDPNIIQCFKSEYHAPERWRNLPSSCL